MGKLLNNFKTKIIISFLFFLIVPISIIGSISYLIAKDSVEKEMVNSASQQIEIIDKTIDNVINVKIHDMEMMAKRIRSSKYRPENEQAFREELKQYADLHPEVKGIYVGTTSGQFILEPYVKLSDDYDPRKRDWYIEAMDKRGEIYLSTPYISEGVDDMVVTISRSIDDGSGVVAVDLLLSYLQQLIGEITIGENGYALLLDKEKNFIVAHTVDKVGTKAEGNFYDALYENTNGLLNHSENGEAETSVYITNELTGWKIVGNVIDAEMKEAAAPIFNTTLIVILIVLVVGAIFGYLILKSLIKPIKLLIEKVRIISQGDLTEKVEIVSNDEIGQLGTAFNEMQESLKTIVQKVEEHADHVAASAEELTASAEQTASATEQVSTSIQQVATGAEQQSSKLEGNVKLLTNVNDETALIAEKSQKVAQLANDSYHFAEIGADAVGNTLVQMKSIQQSVNESNGIIQSLYERSLEVKSILDVISQIAEQTNLLSLNAAIEAARAGEHGRGFAIVADEVRHLAEESQKSSQQIAQIILGIQEDTNVSVKSMEKVMKDVQEGVQISNEANEKFEQILQGTAEITEQIDEISRIAQKITLDIQEVVKSTNDISFISQENAAASQEVAASSEEQLAAMEEVTASAKMLANKAVELKEILGRFKY